MAVWANAWFTKEQKRVRGVASQAGGLGTQERRTGAPEPVEYRRGVRRRNIGRFGQGRISLRIRPSAYPISCLNRSGGSALIAAIQFSLSLGPARSSSRDEERFSRGTKARHK